MRMLYLTCPGVVLLLFHVPSVIGLYVKSGMGAFGWWLH